MAAPTSPILDTHTLETDTPHALSSVERWTCTRCGCAVLVKGGHVYGSASAEACGNPAPAAAECTPVDTSPAGTLRRAADVTVYASQGGDRYHQTSDCRALVSAQMIWDCDGPDDLPAIAPMNGGYAAMPTTALAALGEGKTPCAVCLPGSGAALARSSCEEDFEHLPMPVFTNGKLRTVQCYRCPVPWPCTTALVLGLVDRAVTP